MPKIPNYSWYSSAGVRITALPEDIPPLSHISEMERARRTSVWLEASVVR